MNSHKAQYDQIRTVLDGAWAVRDKGQQYVPQPGGMNSQDYAAYLKRGVFFGIPASTLRALVGLALRKEPVIKLPARLEPMRLAATDDNAPLDILVEDAVREVMSMGRFGMMLDLPAVASPTTTPRILPFKAEEIDEIETGYVDGRKVLTSVVLASSEEFDGEQIHYHLHLVDGFYTVQRFINDQDSRVNIDEAVMPTIAGQFLTYIPFVMMSHEGLRPEFVTPPFLDLSELAISHFRNSCDLEHALHLTASPTPWIAGNIPIDKTPTAIGAGTLWSLPEGTTAGMLEFTGSGVAAMESNMTKKADQMAALGARMLSASINRNETVETATQRTRSELALLHSVVLFVERGVERLLNIAADWVTAPRDDVDVTLSRDFIETTLSHQQIEAQLKLVAAGAISLQTLYENLQQGEVARADRTLEDEQTLVDADAGRAIGMGFDDAA